MHRTLLTAVVSAFVFSSLSCAPVESGRQTIGPAGGSIALRSGLSLDVPQGALEREVEVRVRDVEVSRGEHEVELEPHGLALSVPGTLVVDDDGRRVEALESEHGLLEVHHHGGRVEVRVERLGHVSLRRFEARDGGDDHGSGGNGSDDPAGDDRGGHGADDADAGDDHGGHGGDDPADAGDDHGGLRDGGSDDAADAGDDHGGLRDGGSDDPADAGDDHGGLRDGGSDDADAGAGMGTGGTSCVTDDTCACGSQCVAGACTVVVTCTTDADCSSGMRCREGRRHGQACGVLACNP